MDTLASSVLLKALAADALKFADGEQAVSAALAASPLVGPVRVLAIGKCAAAMWRGAAKQLVGQIIAALVIAPEAAPYGATDIGVTRPQWLVGAHPYPDERSLAAGKAAAEFVVAASAGETLLVLLSGGASALCERLPDHITLAELQALQRALLAADLPIAETNAIRQSLSQIKGGKLARLCSAKVPVRQLIISDVPGDDISVIGSAPFVVPALPPEIVLAQRRATLARLPLVWQQWLQCHEHLNVATPAALAATVHSTVIVSNAAVRSALQQSAEHLALTCVSNTAFAGPCFAVCAQIIETLRSGPSGLYVFGGECHLQLPPQPGRGGRNQHLALALAIALTECPGITVMVLATDGVDGQSAAAGAVFVSGQWPVTDGQRDDANAALASASSYDCWQRQGGLLFTGPTGVNVADLVLCLKP